MNRRTALKGIAATVAVAAVPSLARAHEWPDRVTIGETFNAKNARPYLDGRRVYGGYDGCVSEGWVDVLRRKPDNFTEKAEPMSLHEAQSLSLSRTTRLHGSLEFRTVNPDGSWPD